MTRRRLDAELVRRGLVASRAEAKELVASGAVLVSGAPASKCSRLVAAGEPLVVAAPRRRFVSRGGEKLDSALERFGVDPSGLTALDAGASTGGFTDVLLRRGAARVVSVDVGRHQLHERLRSDPRVDSFEQTDIRTFDVVAAGGPFPLVVADLSFISLAHVAEALARAVAVDGRLVALVKPQFEAGRVDVSRGRGVITSPEIWSSATIGAIAALARHGLTADALCPSPIRGHGGNVEFLVCCRRHPVSVQLARYPESTRSTESATSTDPMASAESMVRAAVAEAVAEL